MISAPRSCLIVLSVTSYTLVLPDIQLGLFILARTRVRVRLPVSHPALLLVGTNAPNCVWDSLHNHMFTLSLWSVEALCNWFLPLMNTCMRGVASSVVWETIVNRLWISLYLLPNTFLLSCASGCQCSMMWILVETDWLVDDHPQLITSLPFISFVIVV